MRAWTRMTWLAAMLAACATPDPITPEDPPTVRYVIVTAPRLTMRVGETMPLAASPRAADDLPLDREVAWSSGNTERATVSPAGVVTAMTPGTATIRATSEGKVGTIVLDLLAAEPAPPDPITVVTVTATSTLFEAGERTQVTATLMLASGETVQRPVTWSSNAPEIASVAAQGSLTNEVQGRLSGDATITATAEGVASSVTIRVLPKPMQDLMYARSTGGTTEIFRLALSAGAAPVRLGAVTGASEPSASPDGMHVAFAVSQVDPLGAPQHDLYVMQRNGQHLRRLTQMPGVESEPTWSPDGSRIAFRATAPDAETSHLWVIDADGTGLTQLTGALPPDVSNIRHPAWSPDGDRLAFIAARNGAHRVWTIDVDGTGATPLTHGGGFDQSPTWSPAGDRIAFARYDNQVPANGWDVLVVAVAGGVPTRLALLGDQLAPVWSPDGAYLVVSGTAVAGVGQTELYTMRPDGTALRLRTTDPGWGGGFHPTWMARP